MNAIWTTLVLICFVVVTFTNPNGLLNLCVDSATQALNYCFQLAAIYALWQGVFCVAERCHLVERLAKLMSTLNNFLYGNVSKEAKYYLSLNMASNIVGIGNASTPSAISAIKLMESGNKLTRGGAMLFVINACGLQLVPTTVMGLRTSFGSRNPSAILWPTVVCTICSLVLGVLLTSLAYPKEGAHSQPIKAVIS